MIRLGMMHTAVVVMSIADSTTYAKLATQTFPVPAGKGPHTMSFLRRTVRFWFTAQSASKLGRLDLRAGKSELLALDRVWRPAA